MKRMRIRGAYVLKVHGNPMQPRTIDLVVCYRGRFIGVESKIPGENATKRQQYTLAEIENAGGLTTVATSIEHVDALMDLVDEEIDGP